MGDISALGSESSESPDLRIQADTLDRERLRLIASNQNGLVWANLAVSCIFAGAMYLATDDVGVFWLLGAMLPFSALRFFVARRFLALDSPTAAQRNAYRNGFVGISFVSGTIWALALVFATPFEEPGPLSISVFVIAGMSAGSIAGLSAYRAAYLAYMLPVNLTFAARCLAEGGELHILITLGLLVYSLALIAFGRNMTRQTIEVLRLNLDNLRLIEETTRERDRAEAASRAKSEFLSSMSHELRTPLNSILGFGQLLDENPDEPLSSTQQRCVRQILSNGAHLLSLIEQVLDLSRIEAGKFLVSTERVSLSELVGHSIEVSRPLVGDRGINFVTDEDSIGSLYCLADQTLLRQVLLNLLSNAIKYNNVGGTVAISAEHRENGMVRLNVADTGIGVSAENRSRLFEPFERLGYERSNIEGTGVGLSIAKQHIERMDGRIGCETEIGAGSTFWIELPSA